MTERKSSVKHAFKDRLEANKESTNGVILCNLIVSAIFTIVFGLYTFPRTNPDIKRIWDLKMDLMVNVEEVYDSWTHDQRDEFWYSGSCFYTFTEQDGIMNKVP